MRCPPPHSLAHTSPANVRGSSTSTGTTRTRAMQQQHLQRGRRPPPPPPPPPQQQQQQPACRSRPHQRRRAVACTALFGGWRQQQRLVERPAYAKREMVQIGSLRVSPMGLGTWAWGNQFLWNYNESMDGELQELFNAVAAAGINLFDTADSYGTGRLNGRSESLLGRFIQEYPGSERVSGQLHVATKFAAYPWRLTRGSVVAAARESLARTGLQQLSIGQLHWSTSNYAPWQEGALVGGLADAAQAGLVAEVGVSNYGAKQMARVATVLERQGVRLASAQVQYSLLSSGPLQESVKAAADDLGVTLIAYSPLALGLLSGKYDETRVPPGPRGLLFRQLLPGIRPLTLALGAVADSRRKSRSQVALNWCICKGTIPIPGAKDVQQARENLGALGWRLSAGEVAELDAAAARCDKVMVQNVFQTS